MLKIFFLKMEDPLKYKQLPPKNVFIVPGDGFWAGLKSLVWGNI